MAWHGPSRPPLRPPATKHYGWWRAYRGLTRHSKWRLVAAQTGLPLERVTLIAIDLLDHASVGTPRGSVAEWSVLEYAATFALDPQEVARVRVCLEAVGWIHQDAIPSWYDHQRDSDADPTAAARQRRRRDRLKAELDALARDDAPLREPVDNVTRDSRVTGQTVRSPVGSDVSAKYLESADDHGKIHGVSSLRHAVTRDVTRDTVTVTLDPDSDLRKKGTGSGSEGPAAGADASEAIRGQGGDPATWLATQGVAALVDRLQTSPELAGVRLSRWLHQLAGDAAELQRIVQAAEAADYMGARYHNLIVDEIRRRTNRAQAQLPLGPIVVRRQD